MTFLSRKPSAAELEAAKARQERTHEIVALIHQIDMQQAIQGGTLTDLERYLSEAVLLLLRERVGLE